MQKEKRKRKKERKGYIVHDAAMNVYRSNQNWSKENVSGKETGGIVNHSRRCYA